MKRSQLEPAIEDDSPALLEEKKPKLENNELILLDKQQFIEFSVFIDRQLDKREAVNRLTREMTLESKKFIYTLQKHAHHNLLLDDHSDREQRVDYGEQGHLDRLLVIMNRLDSELECERNRTIFQRSISAGLQEMIEALTLHYFIFNNHSNASDDQKLISINEMRRRYHFDEMQWLRVEPVDYLLGICDLTGELMRFAITTIPKHFHNAQSIYHLLQQIHRETIAWSHLVTDEKQKAELQSKLQVMQTNCQKVEQSIFEAILTRKEFELGI